MNLQSIVRRARFEHEPPFREMPEWGRLLEEVLAADADADSDGSGSLFEPFVQVIRERLARAAASWLACVAASALSDLESELVAELADLRARLVYDHPADEPGRDRWPSLFDAYPVLARLLAVRCCLWVESSAELLERIARDAADLARTFASGEEPGQATSIVPSLARSRNGRRNVARVRFASGASVIYKPRPVAMERWFFELIARLNASGRIPELRAPRVLQRDGYGWAEDVANGAVSESSCSEERRSTFFHRFGMLWCLAYVLDGTDFRQGNVVDDGEQPVIVDIETLMSVELARGEERASKDALVRGGASTIGARTVLDAGFADWPGLNPEPAAAGFETMYRFVMSSPDVVEQHLDDLSSCETRVFLRETSLYLALQRRQFHPERLRDGLRWSVGLDALARAFEREPASRWKPMLYQERRAMNQLDVPYFGMDGRSTDMRLDDGTVLRDFVAIPGVEGVRMHIAGLGEQDLQRQLAFIRGLEMKQP